ncbi:unnamed protein product [Gordionus sp. m RMFG-2023]
MINPTLSAYNLYKYFDEMANSYKKTKGNNTLESKHTLMESYYYRAFKLSPYRTYAQPPIFDGSENGLKLSINRYARHSKETSLDFSVDNAIIESSYRIPNISPVHKSRGGCADCKGLINDNYIEHLKIFYQILQEEENELLPPVSDNKVNKRNEMNMIEPPYKYIQPTTAAMPRSFFKRPDTPYNFDRSIDRFSSGAQSAESLEKNVGVQRVSRPKSLDKHTSTVQNVSVFTNEEPGLEPSVSDSTEASEDLEDYLTSSDEDEDDEKPKPKRKSKSEKKMDTDIKPSSPSIKSKAKSKHSQDANKEVRPSFSHKPVIEKSPETKADHRNLPKSIHDDGAISGIDPSSLLLKDKVTEGFKPDIPPAYAIQEGAPIKNSSQHIAQSPKKLTSTPKNMSAGFSSDGKTKKFSKQMKLENKTP